MLIVTGLSLPTMKLPPIKALPFFSNQTPYASFLLLLLVCANRTCVRSCMCSYMPVYV